MSETPTVVVTKCRGCGGENLSEPDHEGARDCFDCGVFSFAVAPEIGYVTIIAQRVVTHAVVGGKRIPLPAGTTDVNATEEFRKVADLVEYTWAYAGPPTASVMFVEPLEERWGDVEPASFRQVWDAAGERANAKVRAYDSIWRH